MALAGVRRLLTGSPRRLRKELYAKAKPTRNPLVVSMPADHGLILRAPLETQGTGWLGKIANWSKMPSTKDFELEPVGAFVWNLCDGRNTTETIAKKLRDEFKMNRLEAETALGAFLEILSKRRLIDLVLPPASKRS